MTDAYLKLIDPDQLESPKTFARLIGTHPITVHRMIADKRILPEDIVRMSSRCLRIRRREIHNLGSI